MSENGEKGQPVFRKAQDDVLKCLVSKDEEHIHI